MKRSNRRTFLKQTAGAAVAFAVPFSYPSNLFHNGRKFRLSLNPGAIGVQLSQLQMIERASSLGFEAIVPLPAEISTMSSAQVDLVLGQMSEYDLTWDASGLPIEFREDEVQFRGGIFRLHDVGSALRSVGVKRMSTWIMPTHSELTYLKNFNVHVRRIRQIVDVLKQYDIKLGLEYVGPKTLMTSQRFSFIRTLAEVQELIEEIARPNIGIQLDSFHWFCAGESKDDILGLDKDSIVTCDLNDAKRGRTADQQLDWERELPGVSGVINLGEFLQALKEIGYDGPIRAEPFNEALNKMDDDMALQATYRAMKNSFDLL